MRIGELFILGFRGTEIPKWLLEFESRFGLGGVILFDYNCQTKIYENNIESPQQVTELCRKLSGLTSKPLIFLDQEGGKVRRLKDSRGFAPLPSAWQLNLLSEAERYKILHRSFSEMKKLGFDFNFAPVIDLNINPKNPDIGAIERSFSAEPAEVEANARLIDRVAKEVNMGLCLKHYPGLGGATANSHLELTDLSDSILEAQLELFWKLGKSISGQGIVISHGYVKQWDPQFPISLSRKSLLTLRLKLPDAIFISDDLQMLGLQKKFSTDEACVKGFEAGLDMVCIGNNLMAEDNAVLATVEKLSKEASQLATSINRVAERKKQFK